MNRTLIAGLLLGCSAAACGGSSNSMTRPGAATSVAGIWAGAPVDSTTAALGAGGMMGQAGLGTMIWQLTQSGSTVTGTLSFSGMSGSMMHGSMSGTMSGQDMGFSMDMPAGSMMSGNCSAHVTGTAHMNAGAMTMAATYSGTNSCTGAFNNGQMMMTRR